MLAILFLKAFSNKIIVFTCLNHLQCAALFYKTIKMSVVFKSEYTVQQKNLVFRCNSFIFLCTKNCLNCLHRCTLSVPPYEISIQLLCTHPGKFDRALSIWNACNVWAGNFPASLDTIIHKGGGWRGGLPAVQKYTNSLVAGHHR